ncbi:MAG: hypothetical protein MJY99_08710 [Fibrobacter sp.]|nr:hypothetical protein [Fibrobacter sp.]
MKIEKKKISSDSRWNAATKAGLAALMGMTAIAFSACDGQTASGGSIEGLEDPESSNSENNLSSSQAKKDDLKTSDFNDNEQQNVSEDSSSVEESKPVEENKSTEENSSSSSKITPPALSSSDFYPPLAGVIAPETSSSMESPTPLSSNQVIVDIPKSSSSISEEVLSSIAEATQSSSSEAASSSAIPASSSSEPASSSSDIQILQPNTSPSTWQPDTNSYIHMCPDGTGNCMVFSMVTTFERTDIDV